MIRRLSILFFFFLVTAAVAAPADSAIPILGAANGKAALSTPMQIVILLTLLTLLPAAVMSVSPFLRIVVVLHFLRQALGTQTTPSNQVTVGLALFLAFLVMQPVVLDIYHQGWQPVEGGQLSWQQGFEQGVKPLKTFLLKFAREKDIKTCVEIAKSSPPRTPRPQGPGSGLHSVGVESRFPNWRGPVSPVPDHRSCRRVGHALDRDGPIAAGHGLRTVQDFAFRISRWLESRYRIANEKF